MLARIFCPDSRYGFDAALETFQQAYGGLSAAYALCDGLEVIAVNTVFEKLFDLERTSTRSLFLNRLLHDQNGLERLFSYANAPVEFAEPKHTTFMVQPWPANPQFWLLTVEDRSEIAELRCRLTQASTHEASTGVLRRGAFNAGLHRLLQKMRHEDEAGLLCQISLVSFNNQISGLNGEEKDELITKLAEQFQWEFGKECLVGRHDTLALTLFTPIGLTSGEDKIVLNQIGRLASQITKSHRTTLSVRIGAAVFPEDGKSVATLLEAADLAKSSIVESGRRNDYLTKRISNELSARHLRDQKLMRDMPAAIANGEIHPHFQPVIEPASGTILSFEALIRWQHPTLGYVIPPNIISIAREIGLLDSVTAKTVKAAAQQVEHWPDHVQFAVNVTAEQLNSDLVDLVRQIIRETSIDPARLEIEVTEDALIEDFETSAAIFERLRAIGVSIAMDDFGSGYTSVGNLRVLNFDKIKIDKSISDGLPHDHRSIAIVKSLMYMARELGLRITVEGIETDEQLEFLRAFNCGVQGYVYSPAVPPSQLHELKRFLPSGREPAQSGNVLGIGPRKLQQSSSG